MTELRIAIVGFGKIARDQHVGAIAAVPGATLAAVASRNASLPGLPHFATIEELLERVGRRSMRCRCARRRRCAAPRLPWHSPPASMSCWRSRPAPALPSSIP
ncbi:hypothetical protein ACVWW2_003700 [Bradyrhizobium sp. LM4.3]